MQFIYTYISECPEVRQLLDFIALPSRAEASTRCHLRQGPVYDTVHPLPNEEETRNSPENLSYLLRLRANHRSLFSRLFVVVGSASRSQFLAALSRNALHRVTPCDEKEMKRDFRRDPGEYIMD